VVAEASLNFDLAVIGAGSAGLSVAAAAAQFGEKVVLFERDNMGGDCLNTGCVPSKALLAAAKHAQVHRSSGPYGISPHEPKVSFADVMAHVAGVIETIAPIDSQERFEGLGVTVVRAHARFTSPTTLQADGKSYTARRIVIATGSRAGVPPIPGLAETDFMTNESLFKNRVLPQHLIIIGGGPIGMEMAQAHCRLGSEVTVLEAQQPLGKDDPELASIVLEALRKDGIAIRAGAEIATVAQRAGSIQVSFKNGETITGSHLLVAAGRVPNLEGLDLEAGGVAFDKRGITVDQALRSTTNRKVYAAGDIAGGLQFTHVAGYQAGLIIRNLLFRLPVKNRTDIIPWVTYTEPELAHVGLTEVDARKRHGDAVKVLRWPFKENDRAQAEGKTAGLVKVITGKRGVVLGCSIAGPHAGEQIAMWTLAVSNRIKISAIANTVLAYPTLAEAGKRAAITYYAGLAQKPLTRRLIGMLKVFG
jgi:pyruvate/2-oxoglutarate dehydrogenase complex dihydrolipoamide dehydrogenase (E3) component